MALSPIAYCVKPPGKSSEKTNSPPCVFFTVVALSLIMSVRELEGALVGGNESICGFVFGPRDLLIAVSNHLRVMAELANGFEDDFDKKPIVPGHGQCPADSPPASGASMCSQALNRRGGQIAFRGTRGDPYRRKGSIF